MKNKIFGLMLILIMVLVFVPNIVCASTYSISIKPKDVEAEYSIKGEALVPTEFIVTGDLKEGDKIQNVTYKGSQLYTGTSDSEITSYKIMRGDVDVTDEYAVTLEKGKLTVNTFGMPSPCEEIDIVVGEQITREDLEILLGVDGLTATHTGVGSYSLTDGFTSNEIGEAKLTYTIPGVDKGGDSLLELSAFDVEIEITVVENSSLINYKLDIENGIATVNDVEQNRAKAGDNVILISNGAPKGQEFDKWEIKGVTLSDPTKWTISFVMPSNNVSAKALYKDVTISSMEEYDFIDNTEKQEFKTGKLSEYVIKINADYDKFESLSVDGKDFVRDEDYIVTSGSTIITFTKKGLEKLNSLTVGEHEIAVSFRGKSTPVVAKLKIETQKATPTNTSIENPQTFDAGVLGYAILGVIAVTGITITTVVYRKKQTN